MNTSCEPNVAAISSSKMQAVDVQVNKQHNHIVPELKLILDSDLFTRSSMECICIIYYCNGEKQYEQPIDARPSSRPGGSRRRRYLRRRHPHYGHISVYLSLRVVRYVGLPKHCSNDACYVTANDLNEQQ